MRRRSLLPLALLSLALLSPALLLVACPSRPSANLGALGSGSEPTSRGEVFVEREPGEEAGRMPRTVTPEIANLYKCWFREPYDYMFGYSGPTFDANGRSYGMLTAGISGLLYYGGLSPCAAEQLGATEQGWGNPDALARLAGVPYQNPALSIPQFNAINPEFVVWARKTLLLDPEALIDGYRAQDAYDRVFQRFFRLMTLSALGLAERLGSVTAIENEARSYLAATDAGAWGPEWLDQQYAGMVPAYPEMQDGTTMTTGMAAGFWLRRQVDGTLGVCWHGAMDVMEMYDRAWLAEQRSGHAQAFAVLDAVPDR